MPVELAENRNPAKEWTIWVALFILPLVFYPKVLASTYVSNYDVHALLEFWAGFTALTAAGIILVHFFATGKRFFLLISLGFTLQGTEDLVHAVYAWSRIWPAEQASITSFVPGTYVVGRLILIVCIILALYFGKTIVDANKRRKEAILYNSLGFLTAAITMVIIINLPLPRFMLEGPISRPVDLVAAIIYLIAFFCFVNVYKQRETHTPFMWSMIASIIFGFAAQIYMVYSQRLYDAQFDMAHIIKIFSYIFPIFGIAVGTFGMYKKEEELAKGLRISGEMEKKAAREAIAAKNAARKTKAYSEGLISSMTDGLWVIDLEGKTTDINQAMLEMLGHEDRTEMIGRNPADFTAEKDIRTTARLVKAAFRGSPSSGIVDLIKKDGKFIPVSVVATPVKDEKNNIVGGFAIIRDITESKKAEEVIVQQKEFLQKIIESLPHPFYVINADDYTIVMANKATGANISKNTTCYALTHREDKPCEGEHVCPLKMVKKTKREQVVEHIHYGKDGMTHLMEVHGYPIFDDKGNVVQMVEYSLDVTERKKAEEELIEAYDGLKKTQKQLIQSAKMATVGQ
ncbi:MAG: PAS domain S-box protein, partial [Candidatus Omnitrophica bacterium]|nr:PAS domain S-box protein [Candidatus Omnitrophota bacterium]